MSANILIWLWQLFLRLVDYCTDPPNLAGSYLLMGFFAYVFMFTIAILLFIKLAVLWCWKQFLKWFNRQLMSERPIGI